MANIYQQLENTTKRTSKSLDAINLWNSGGNNPHKTRDTITYINSLELPSNMSGPDQRKRFGSIKHDALLQTTANAMLDIIGYEYNRRPHIYDVIAEME